MIDIYLKYARALKDYEDDVEEFVNNRCVQLYLLDTSYSIKENNYYRTELSDLTEEYIRFTVYGGRSSVYTDELSLSELFSSAEEWGLIVNKRLEAKRLWEAKEQHRRMMEAGKNLNYYKESYPIMGDVFLRDKDKTRSFIKTLEAEAKFFKQKIDIDEFLDELENNERSYIYHWNEDDHIDLFLFEVQWGGRQPNYDYDDPDFMIGVNPRRFYELYDEML